MVITWESKDGIPLNPELLAHDLEPKSRRLDSGEDSTGWEADVDDEPRGQGISTQESLDRALSE